jgi:hypothetical protein
VLYEPGRPDLFPSEVLAQLEALASIGDWDQFALTFFRDALHVPIEELEAVRASELWPPIVADAPGSHQDIRALTRYTFEAGRYHTLDMPVLLQIGSESPRELYVARSRAAECERRGAPGPGARRHDGSEPRTTVDVDIVLRNTEPDIVRFLATLAQDSGQTLHVRVTSRRWRLNRVRARTAFGFGGTPTSVRVAPPVESTSLFGRTRLRSRLRPWPQSGSLRQPSIEANRDVRQLSGLDPWRKPHQTNAISFNRRMRLVRGNLLSCHLTLLKGRPSGHRKQTLRKIPNALYRPD